MFDVEEYHAAVRALGMTDAVADWWLGLNRPGVIFGPQIDGPSGGQFGGAPRLPADLRWPTGMTFVADIDCAALPREGVAEGFPRDGHLLFFSDLDFDHPQTRVIHVPAGTPVGERALPQAEDYHIQSPKQATTQRGIPVGRAVGLLHRGDPGSGLGILGDDRQGEAAGVFRAGQNRVPGDERI